MFKSFLDGHILIYIALMFVFVGFASWIARKNECFRSHIQSKLDNPRFDAHLEGLRGILAINVFFHHAAFIFQELKLGTWEMPSSHFMVLIGDCSVALFFFLSGYLFWSGFRRKKEDFSYLDFYKARLYRIYPLYAVFCFILFAFVAVKTNFTIAVPISDLFQGGFQWLTVNVPMGYFPDVNAMNHTHLFNSGVTWSLRHEIQFYLFIPFLRGFAQGNKTWRLALLCVMVHILFLGLAKVLGGGSLTADQIYVIRQVLLECSKFMLIGFLPGIVTAYLYQSPDTQRFLSIFKGRTGALIMTGPFLFLMFNTNPALYFLKVIPLIAIFMTIVIGGIGKRFLSHRGFVMLGLLSYAVYLVHGIFLTLLTARGFDLYRVLLGEPHAASFWALIGCIGLVLILITAATYRYVELPGMELGKKTKKKGAFSLEAKTPSPVHP